MSQQQVTTRATQASSDKDNRTSSCADHERGWIVHRNRNEPTPDPNETIINQLKFYLDRYKIRLALAIFFDEATLKMLSSEKDFMWDLIPLICKRLRGLCQYRFRVFEGCEKMLHRIAIDEDCNTKEILISFLTEISGEDDNVFRAMIRPLECVLLRMNRPKPRDENLRWVTNILARHITNIGLFEEYDTDSKKRTSWRDDPRHKRYVEVLPLMLGFIETFYDPAIESNNLTPPILTQSQIEGVLNGELDEDSIMERGHGADACVTALMNLMYKPMTFMDLTLESLEMKIISNRYLSMLLKLRPNLFSTIYRRIDNKSLEVEADNCNQTTDNANEKPSNDTALALATCSYIYWCERVGDPEETVYPYPQVITHQSLLACHIPYVVLLLNRTEIFAHEKGLILLETLLEEIDNHSLDIKFLTLFEDSKLLKQILQIIIFSPLGTSRRRAYGAFSKICDFLTFDCKYKLFMSLLNQSELRPCVRATCIDQYRKHLTVIYRELVNLEQRKADQPDNSTGELARQQYQLWTSRYRLLCGQPLIDFLEICMRACLPDLQHTDIIENYELLLATLTMLRFLKLRKQIEQPDNKVEEEFMTGKRLKYGFFDPIRGAIALITKDLKETKGITQQDETDCLSWALCRLDLIESVLVRTCDLYNC